MKQDQVSPFQTSANLTKPSNTNQEIVISTWEPIKSWTLKTSGTSFFFTKPINQMPSDGAVLVFVRNLWSDDPSFTQLVEPDEPLMMPFNFLPLNKKPVYVERWNYKASDNILNIELDVSSSQESALINPKAELQYIIIPQKLLVQKGQTEQALHEMSYNEVMHYLNLAS